MRTTLPVLLIFTSAFVACASDPSPLENPSQDGGTNPADECEPEDLLAPSAELEALDRVQCERQIECGVPLFNQATTVADCIRERRTADLVASLAARGASPAGRNACLCRLEYEQNDCRELRTKRPRACAQLLAGAREEGDECALNFDCREGLVCAGIECPGHCATEPEQCSEESCSGSEWCNSVTGACEPFAQPGERCFGSQCTQDFFCGFAPDGLIDMPPTCISVPAAGERCISAEGSCPKGYTCQGGDGTPQVCRPELTAGDECTGASECGAGLYCDFAIQQCSPQAGLREACRNFARNCADGLRCAFTPGGECSVDARCAGGNQCCQVDGQATCIAPGQACAPLEGVCEAEEGYLGPEIRLLEPGDPCETGDCPVGTVCRLDPDGSQVEICAAPFALGESCVVGLVLDPNTCEPGHYCDFFDDSRCVEWKLPGEPCSATSGFTLECASFICEDGVCGEWGAQCD